MAAGGRALLVALIAVAGAAAVVVVGDTAPVCDGISCGMGTCKLPILPNPYGYECDCSLGWLRLDLLAITPCSLPICPSDLSCHTPKLKPLPNGKNFTTDACLAVDCGPEGACVKEESSPYFHCQCNPGTANARNDPTLWCTNCVVGDNGCAVPPPPPAAPPSAGSPPPPSMAPTVPHPLTQPHPNLAASPPHPRGLALSHPQAAAAGHCPAWPLRHRVPDPRGDAAADHAAGSPPPPSHAARHAGSPSPVASILAGRSLAGCWIRSSNPSTSASTPSTGAAPPRRSSNSTSAPTPSTGAAPPRRSSNSTSAPTPSTGAAPPLSHQDEFTGR